MASICKVIEVDAAPEAVWDALADFQAVHRRVAPGFVTGSRPEGEDRVVTFAAGVGGGLGATHHQASVEVQDNPGGTGGCRLVWITDVLPDALGPVIEGLMDQGAGAIARTLSG